MFASLFYLVAGAGALVAGTGALLAIADPMLRATVAPAGITILAVAAGGIVLLRRERLLAGPLFRKPNPIRPNEPEPAAFPPNPNRTGAVALAPNEPEKPESHERTRASAATAPNRTNEPGQPAAATTARASDLGDLLALDEVEPVQPAHRQAPAHAAIHLAEASAPFCTNEPETTRQAAGRPGRFGTFSLFRRTPVAPDRSDAARKLPNEPEAAAIPAAGPPPAEAFSLPPVSARVLAELDETSDLLDTEDSRIGSVVRAVETDSLVPVLVPVVSLPQRRRRMVHVRLDCEHLGASADPHALVPAGGPLRAALDLELLRAAIRQGEQPRPGSENLPVLAAVAAASFADPEALTALRTLLGRRAPASTPLHVVLDAWPTERSCLEMLAVLRDANVGFGLMLNERPHLSPDAIASRRIGVVCLDAEELRRASLGATDGDLVHDIRALQRREIEVIVTGIGDERALAEVLDYPVHLGSGRLFGRIG